MNIDKLKNQHVEILEKISFLRTVEPVQAYHPMPRKLPNCDR